MKCQKLYLGGGGTVQTAKFIKKTNIFLGILGILPRALTDCVETVITTAESQKIQTLTHKTTWRVEL